MEKEKSMAILKVIQDFGNWFWGIPILILIGGGGITVDFDEKQRAITEGQFCVFYDDEKCLGGGIIEKAIF